MKIHAILAFVFVAALLFAMPLAFAENVTVAENATVDEETVAEINDELNESVSGMRIGWERVKLAFTFGDDKKAMQEFKLAKLRLIQARIAAKNGNEKAMEKALEAHERIIERVRARVNAMDGTSDNRSARLAAAKLVGLERAIEVHEARISKLGEILASENLTEEQRARIEMQIEKAQNVTDSLKALSADKKEKLKTKMRAVSNMTEEEVESAIEEIEDNQHLSAVKALVAQKRAEHQERIAERLEFRKDIWNNLSNETREEIGDAVRQQIRERIGDRQGDSESENETETESGNGQSGSSGSGNGNSAE